MTDISEREKAYYIKKLKEIASAEERFPKKSDFSAYDVMKIKSYFGPWPRALEAAGLKQPKNQSK